MLRVLNGLILLAFLAPGWGWADQHDQTLCGELTSDFEALTLDFVRNWKGESDFCEFKRFTILNEMIASDMILHPQVYEHRMSFLYNLKKNGAPEPINYLLLSFQETWFDSFIDLIVMHEQGKADRWSRWLTMGTASSVMLLLALPLTKRYSSKPIRLFKTGLKHFLHKRALTFGTTSVGTQVEKFRTKREKPTALVFVPPPLYFGGQEDVLDERSYEVYLKELQEDVVSAVGGIMGGWFVGHAASVVVRDQVAKSWAETALKRFKWAQSKPAVFASPGMIVGFAVTLTASNEISDMISKIQFNNRFKKILSKFEVDLKSLGQAIDERNELAIFSQSEKIRNDLALYNFLLTQKLSEGLASHAQAAAEILVNRFSYCIEDREDSIANQKKKFRDEVVDLIRQNEQNLKAAAKLILIAKATFDAHPHPFIKNLQALNENLRVSVSSMLDAEVMASDFWQNIIEEVGERPVECVDLTTGVPL